MQGPFDDSKMDDCFFLPAKNNNAQGEKQPWKWTKRDEWPVLLLYMIWVDVGALIGGTWNNVVVANNNKKAEKVTSAVSYYGELMWKRHNNNQYMSIRLMYFSLQSVRRVLLFTIKQKQLLMWWWKYFIRYTSSVIAFTLCPSRQKTTNDLRTGMKGSALIKSQKAIDANQKCTQSTLSLK